MRHHLSPRFLTEADPINWLRFALCFVAEFAFTRGWRYTIDREPIPAAVQLISANASVTAWGIAWFLACACAVASIPKAWPGGSLPTICLSLGFSLGFTISWVKSWGVPGGIGNVPGAADYTSAGLYWFVFGALSAGYFLALGAMKWANHLDTQ